MAHTFSVLPRLPENTANTTNPERLQAIALRSREKHEEITLVRNPRRTGYRRMAAADDRLPQSRRILRLVSRVAQPGACNERNGC
ncbi:hypothetical protein [Sinorhizobium psoraleae]|uniref:hypothetical protein n=1 Tax=Sinorhizobium psoraleae TaxID=520838 RepID=UPI00156A4A4B|nr:hypothetical protein [Sinorhizobium psoraleae]